MYENTKLHAYIFVLSLLAFCFSPPYNQSMAWQQTTKEATGSMSTGVVTQISRNWKSDKTWLLSDMKHWKETQCWKECKISTLTWIGIDAQLAKPLVENCKRLATDPRHCIIAWASIIMAESGGKLKNCYKFNCMWYWVSRFRYTSYEVQIIDWIGSYNKYWYKAKSANFFYPPKWEYSKSRYCVSEESTWSSVGCPAWLGHASKTWNLLSKKF